MNCIFHEHDRKSIKYLLEQKVLVCFEASMGPLQTHKKTFFSIDVLLIFLTDHDLFFITSRLFTQQFANIFQ